MVPLRNTAADSVAPRKNAERIATSAVESAVLIELSARRVISRSNGHRALSAHMQYEPFGRVFIIAVTPTLLRNRWL